MSRRAWSLAVPLLLFGNPGLTFAEEPPKEGALSAFDEKGAALGPCPLKHTEVALEISGDIVHAEVTQLFENPFDQRIEAVYAFPLPEKAAINGFEMSIGDRVIV